MNQLFYDFVIGSELSSCHEDYEIRLVTSSINSTALLVMSYKLVFLMHTNILKGNY